MINNLMIRQCDHKDLETLQVLGAKTFAETFLADNSPDDIDTYVAEHFSAQQLGRELDDANSMLLLVEYQGIPVAYMKLNFEQAQTEGEYPGSLEIQRIYVLKEFKRMHIGKRLVDTAVEIANREHLDYIWLGVWEHNSRAIAFYEKQGFKKFATHSFKLGNDIQQDHIMRMDL
jgi:ribosomal protein S18 acetylase RimI-like enzyme